MHSPRSACLREQQTGRLALIAACLTLLGVAGQAGATLIWVAYDGSDPALQGHQYAKWDSSGTWTAAFASTPQAAHLVTVGSWEEQRWLISQFPLTENNDATGNAWIGLTDEVVEGDYRWVTGEPFVFEFWGPGEPNNDENGNEDYIHMCGGKTRSVDGSPYRGAWNDYSDYHTFSALYEKGPASAVPEPASLALLAIAGGGIAAGLKRRRAVR
jgi:hypothetical protein